MPKYQPLTADQMVTVKTMAPFELADIFREWQSRVEAFDLGERHATPADFDGLGPPWACEGEPMKEYAERMAAGIIHLLKEA